MNFDPKLQPKNYEIAGTHPDSKILFVDVNILDCTGRMPYKGDVLIEGLVISVRIWAQIDNWQESG